MEFETLVQNPPNSGDVLKVVDDHPTRQYRLDRAFVVSSLNPETGNLRCYVNAKIVPDEDGEYSWVISTDDRQGLRCYLTDSAVMSLLQENRYRIDNLYVNSLVVVDQVDTQEMLAKGDKTRKYLKCDLYEETI